MQRRLKRIVLCCALLLCCAGYSRASFQDPDPLNTLEETSDTAYTDEEYEEPVTQRPVIYSNQRPTEARWLEVTSDDAYSYRTRREFVKRPPAPPRKESALARALEAFFMFLLTTPGKILLWSLLILISGYIVYRLVLGESGLFSRRDIRPEAAVESGELSEEGLMERNWEARMREALEAGDQRSAIRFGYLHVLQQLQGRELIRFSPEKTNISYYRELAEAYRPGFRNLTRVYEFAWYGGYLPEAGGMEDYLKNLEQFLRSIPRT
jgi:hypothetical protein